MLRLEPITPNNWREPLRVRKDQRRYVSEGPRLLARAYAYRERHSEARQIVAGNEPARRLYESLVFVPPGTMMITRSSWR